MFRGALAAPPQTAELLALTQRLCPATRRAPRGQPAPLSRRHGGRTLFAGLFFISPQVPLQHLTPHPAARTAPWEFLPAGRRARLCCAQVGLTGGPCAGRGPGTGGPAPGPAGARAPGSSLTARAPRLISCPAPERLRLGRAERGPRRCGEPGDCLAWPAAPLRAPRDG